MELELDKNRALSRLIYTLPPPLRPSFLRLSYLFSFVATRLSSSDNKICSRSRYRANCTIRDMGFNDLQEKLKKPVKFRLCNVSGYSTELLEIHADSPTLHVLFIVGNPGVVTFYKDFMGSLYDLLGGNASITAIGHISHTMKNWEHGRLFSFQEQIDHKIDFVTQHMQNTEVPIVLVGHSIGSYISIELLKSLKEKVICCVGLYPFLALNPESWKQSAIMKIAESTILSSTVSLIIACFGLLPMWLSSLIASAFLWRSWSATAVEAATSHLLQYSTMRNVLFMTLTEFRKLSETPDWDFMRENQSKIAFLFGIDDHWGPLQMFEEISKQAPGIGLSIEREGHTHAFCCTEAGSTWVARHVASLISKRVSNLSK